MGTIMRGDQTLRLIQLYYNNYPEIARNTQDADGRRLRSQIWQGIAEELNAAYDTNFSVEQYKKKIQNVQCTSRQKIQTGKRNLGVAEFEYLRLFEQERLTCNGFNMDAYDSLTRSSSTDLSSNVKVEQMLEQFGITLETSHNLENACEQGSNSDSDSNTTTTAPSTLPENPPRSPQTNILDPRHLIFALGQLTKECKMNPVNPIQNSSHGKVESPEKEERDTIKRTAVPDETEVNRIMAVKKRKLNGLFNIEDKWKKEIVENQQQILDGQHRLIDQIHAFVIQQSQHNHLNLLSQKVEKLCTVLGNINETLTSLSAHSTVKNIQNVSRPQEIAQSDM
ncbi:unnamed protein product [Bursaphelenchus xylophilus]|uniref:Regulatory protein zeste n=1 Tax=Bursaphelenchus xylophilus TaxID=6326 RepID=A0A7I8X6S3_BURXY|nr:unnamed protein product [Bursaphelenchus xylophilus]CAG9123660.1 unnamed protein product [Bursaphelenchus xylophilus]